jgi:hypothetical protein
MIRAYPQLMNAVQGMAVKCITHHWCKGRYFSTEQCTVVIVEPHLHEIRQHRVDDVRVELSYVKEGFIACSFVCMQHPRSAVLIMHSHFSHFSHFMLSHGNMF